MYFVNANNTNSKPKSIGKYQYKTKQDREIEAAQKRAKYEEQRNLTRWLIAEYYKQKIKNVEQYFDNEGRLCQRAPTKPPPIWFTF